MTVLEVLVGGLGKACGGSGEPECPAVVGYRRLSLLNVIGGSVL